MIVGSRDARTAPLRASKSNYPPVFVARVADPAALRLDPDEVDDAVWEPWTSFRAAVLAGDREVSHWCREQVLQLPADPAGASAASTTDLPPAARP